MKAILTKPEKERLLEQFEKSGKTHAQFAEENGLNAKTLSKWIYEWHHQIKTTNEVKFVEIKTTAISSVNDIRIKKSGMEILIPAILNSISLKIFLQFWLQKDNIIVCRCYLCLYMDSVSLAVDCLSVFARQVHDIAIVR